MKSASFRRLLIVLLGAVGFLLVRTPISSFVSSSTKAKGPSVRLAAPDAGNPLSDLTLSQLAFFEAGKLAFESEEDVAQGLGPRMNLDSCAGCHSYPAPGGASGINQPSDRFEPALSFGPSFYAAYSITGRRIWRNFFRVFNLASMRLSTVAL